jgi:predicted phosphodiesterase
LPGYDERAQLVVHAGDMVRASVRRQRAGSIGLWPAIASSAGGDARGGG